MNNPPNDKRKKPAKKPRALPEEDLDREEDRLFGALWSGTVDGEAFDGDPADLW